MECGTGCEHNNPVHDLGNPECRMVWDKETGWGIASLQEWKAGDIVLEYRGDIITEKQKNAKLERIGPAAPVYFQEFANCHPNYCVDAEHYGTIARFVNHRCGEPNLRFETWWTDGTPRCVLEAQTDIHPGDIYTVAYHMIQDRHHHSKCACGHIACRGYMGREVPATTILKLRQAKALANSPRRKKQ